MTTWTEDSSVNSDNYNSLISSTLWDLATSYWDISGTVATSFWDLTSTTWTSINENTTTWTPV